MASTKFYLDHRNVADGCECPLKIAIYSTGRSALINLGIKLLPKQWDNKRNRVINHPQSKALNLWLCHRKQQIDLFICERSIYGKPTLTAKEIKDLILARDK